VGTFPVQVTRGAEGAGAEGISVLRTSEKKTFGQFDEKEIGNRRNDEENIERSGKRRKSQLASEGRIGEYDAQYNDQNRRDREG
jgi:hypothetical protein